ncbi:MAG TPA: glycosyltransferase family 1 protein [Chryseolinea sp.]
MKIFFTNDIFTTQRVGGISRYHYELARQLELNAVPYTLFGGLYLTDAIRDLKYTKGFHLPKPGWQFNRQRRMVSDFLEKFYIPDRDDTIVHYTYFRSPRPVRQSSVIVTVHDMIHELHANDSNRQVFHEHSKAKRAICEKADRIITISRSTKADLTNLFQIDPEKIIVVHLANSIHPSPKPEIEVAHDKPYLLYVGNRGDYKNFERLVRVYATSSWLRSEFDLVCFGSGPFSEVEVRLFLELRVNGKIHHRTGSDTALASYYANASAFVYPSCYEGFGLPLLEAMGMGCPVFAARNSSLPEVAGDAAVYFEASDEESMRQSLEATLQDSDTLKKLVHMGFEREKMFSWQKCFQETMQVYKTVLKGK